MAIEIDLNKLRETLLSKKLEMSSGCWFWLGAKNTNGYGIIHVGEHRMGVHRASFIAFRNSEFNSELNVLHICNKERCFNPAHLYQGTQVDNVNDQIKAGTHPNASKTYCKNGHEFTEENTGRQKAGRYCKTCLRMRNLMRISA